jgi:hypothetical protein
MKKLYIYIASLPTWVIFLIMIFFLIMSSQVTFGYTIFSFILLAWLLSVGLSLHSKVPTELMGSATFFKINIFYGFIFLFIIDFFKIEQTTFLIPFQLYGIYSFFYSLYFVSRSLVIAEEQKKVKTDRYLGTLFLFWFAPIGIWFLNPRIKSCIN